MPRHLGIRKGTSAYPATLLELDALIRAGVPQHTDYVGMSGGSTEDIVLESSANPGVIRVVHRIVIEMPRATPGTVEGVTIYLRRTDQIGGIIHALDGCINDLITDTAVGSYFAHNGVVRADNFVIPPGYTLAVESLGSGGGISYAWSDYYVED